MKLNKTCKVFDCHFVVKMKDVVNMTIITNVKDPSPSQAKVECDAEYETKENAIYIDNVAKKRFKILKIAKIVVFILIIAVLIGILSTAIE